VRQNLGKILLTALPILRYALPLQTRATNTLYKLKHAKKYPASFCFPTQRTTFVYALK